MIDVAAIQHVILLVIGIVAGADMPTDGGTVTSACAAIRMGIIVVVFVVITVTVVIACFVSKLSGQLCNQ